MTTKPFTIDLTDSDEYQPLLQGTPQTQGMRSGKVTLLPGEYCGQHSTDAHEEQLTFLHGQGTALYGPDQSPVPVGTGKILYVPPHTQHNVYNPGPEKLIYIYCVTPIK